MSRKIRLAEDDLGEEIWFFGKEKTGEGSCASESNGCFDLAFVEQLSTLGATRARQRIQVLQEKFNRFEALHQAPVTPVHPSEREEGGGLI